MASREPTPRGDGRDRRAFRREPARLAAQLQIPGAAPRPCTVRQYCLGGLLLGFPSPLALSVGETVTVHCALPPGGDRSHLDFRGRIVHADGDSAGLAFIDPDLSALQRLQETVRDLARQTVSNGAVATDADQALNPADRPRVVQGCNHRVREILAPLIQRFYQDLNEVLFQAAEDSREIAVQNANLQALGVLNRHKDAVQNAFLEAAERRLAGTAAGRIGAATDAEPLAMPASDSLSLVEPQAFEEWLSITGLVGKVETEHRETLTALTRRLSLVLGTPINDRNNPYGPALFAESLQEAIASLDLAHSAKLVCYKALKAGAHTVAGQLYGALNDFLIEQGVLPNLTFSFKRAGEPRTQPPQTRADAGGPAPGDVPSAVDAPDTPSATPGPSTGTGPGGAAASSDPAAYRPAGAGTVSVPDLYQLVGDLRSLQSRLGRSVPQAGVAAGPAAGDSTPSHASTAAGPATARPYNTTELLEALSSPEFRRQLAASSGASGTVDVRRELETVLAGGAHGAASKDIPEHQGRVIDVAGNLFASLLTDLQVARSVRPWIEKLEVPVLKMALLDDRLFLDKNHVVRQVINKLSELEILADSENERERAALQHAFRWIVNLINTEFDGTTAVFHRVARQLDLLLRVQNDTYRKNLGEVVAECVRREPTEEPAPQARQRPDTEDTDEWLRRVRRLEEGHWILFDARRAEPKRLKTAWIAPHSAKYVFVNVLGRKERIVGEAQLAALLHDGDAVVLDAADEPAMDRAQYSMLQKLHRQLLYQAAHDPLTGLINRVQFKKCLAEAVAGAKYTERRHALVFLDIDQFKVVNNTLGYEAGDALLKDLAALLESRIGADHTLGRVGPDQFAILLRDHSVDQALGVVEAQMEELHGHRVSWRDQRLSISVSVGLVGIHAHEENESALLQAAESSCGVAKEKGGGRTQIYHSRHAALSRRREEMKWAMLIDRALDEDALNLRCQKIVPLQEHISQQVWYELLLGLSDELSGQMALQEFIRAAEHYSRIIEVDRWVIRNAFEWIAHHEDELLGIGGFTINLSGPSLNDERLIRYVNEQAARTGVPMHRICFEITETAGIASLSDASDFINVIKSTGCKFSLDDFGSGMSSYAYLKNLPVDFLKIDGAFVRDLAENTSDFAVVKSMCEVGHFMEKAVIAEFVQSERSIELLRGLGVDYAQGYAVERPHRLEELLIA
ncbi:phytochrome-like protein cph2 [bacterium BMS3Bbin12]|nr:phytochrome-like protein cph2 [bacterium BMS3Bbin12]GBE51051.1 phytochrome-like protein cph2 [bacterium BMS3Bbin13]